MRHAFALIISVFFLNTLFCQQASLGFVQNGVSITVGGSTFSPDSVVAAEGAPIEYRFFVENNGGIAFNGFVDLVITPDTVGGQIDTLFSNSNVSLNPGDTALIVVQDSFDTSQGRYTPSGGGSGGVVVIVVWPAARGSVIDVTDTVRITIMVDPLSVTKGWEGKGLAVSAYPNPTTSKLYIDYGTLKKEVGYVRFLDMNGKEVFYSGNPIDQLDLSDWPSGTYFLYMGGNENQSAVYKVVKR